MLQRVTREHGTAIRTKSTSQRLLDNAADEEERARLLAVTTRGRFQRHTALNDIMKYALSAAHVPSRLEPTGLLRSDGKRPDGVTLAPWKCGQLLVWDATCPNTFAPSYRTHATSEPGRVAALAEDRKVDKYRDLPRSHLFCPLSIETMGAMGPRSLDLVREVGRRIAMETGEPQSTDFLLQRLSVAVQRGNCASVLGGI